MLAIGLEKIMAVSQGRLSVLLFFAVGVLTAQWPVDVNQALVGFQSNKPLQSLVPVNAGVSSQWVQNPSQSGSPAPNPFGVQLQSFAGAQGQQTLQHPVKKLTWRFPAPPQIPTPPVPLHFERPSDTFTTQGIVVTCNETAVKVELDKELFSTGTINIAAFTLGGCAARRMFASRFLIFESVLHGCNSQLTVTENELVYDFFLGTASVPVSGLPIVRSAASRILIQCHYPRFRNVSSSALLPAWIPYASTQAAEEQLVFSLRLMMDDWVSVRPSYQYYLGEIIYIEASVVTFNHVPLRVLVDSCVATPISDMNVVPRYFFIENYGCLVDAKLTQSISQFRPQTQASKLGFQIEAFRFQQGNSNLVYFACILKATVASAPADVEHKACSFSNNRWVAAYGIDQVCSCCDSSCGLRKGRDLSEQGLELVKEVSLGPIVILENV